MRKKSTMIQIFTAALVLASASALFADGVFLKDGSIKEGRVLKQTSESITLLNKEEIKMEIPAKKVLRVVRNDDFKNLYTIRKNNSTEFKAYVVFEDKNTYIFRAKLYSPLETTITKEKIMIIIDSNDKVRNSTYAGKGLKYSPRKAALLSLLPMYSGSLISGNKPVPGYLFAVAKSAAFVGPLFYPLVGAASSSGTSGYDAGRYFKDKNWQIYAGISYGLWALLTAVDAYYSFRYISKINLSMAPNEMAQGSFSWAVTPRFYLDKGKLFDAKSTFEGVNIRLTTCF